MPRRPHLRLTVRPLAAVLVLLLGAGCGAVEVPRSTASAEERRACAALLDDLPDTLSGQEPREVTGNPEAAAWGDPAIVLRCGVPVPADFEDTSPCQTVNGLDWFVPTSAIDDQHSDVLMTTIGRAPGVEVSLPAQYRPPAEVMVDVGAVVEAHTTPTGGCR